MVKPNLFNVNIIQIKILVIFFHCQWHVPAELQRLNNNVKRVSIKKFIFSHKYIMYEVQTGSLLMALFYVEG